MIILRLLLLLTNLHLKLLSTQGTGADKLLSTQRVKFTPKQFYTMFVQVALVVHYVCTDGTSCTLCLYRWR